MGSLGPLLGALWSVLAALGASVDDPGPIKEPLEAVLGRSHRLFGRSWDALGASAGDLGPLLGLCGWSWAALGPLWAVLCYSWGPCGRS